MLNGNGALDTSTHRLFDHGRTEPPSAVAEPPTEEQRSLPELTELEPGDGETS